MLSLKNVRISKKLPVMIAALVAASVIAVMLVSFTQARKIVHTQAGHQLSTAAAVAATRIDDWFIGIAKHLTVEAESPYVSRALSSFSASWEKIDGDPTSYLQRHYVAENPFPAVEKLKYVMADDGSLYSKAHKKYHEHFQSVLESRGYYNLFIFDIDGNMVYSVYKEKDYATNFVSGQWSSTDLGAAFRAAKSRDDTVFYDFAPYGPSAGAPASFIARPVHDSRGEFAGVLAFQMPVDNLNALLAETEALYENANIFAVGADGFLRSDSAATPENDILATPLRSPPVSEGSSALTSITGITGGADYAASRDWNFQGTTWRIFATQPQETALAPVVQLRNTLMLPISLALLAAAVFGLLIARSICLPIRNLNDAIKDVAGGKLNEAIPNQDRGDELGDISNQLDKLRLSLSSAESEHKESTRRTSELQASQSMVVDRLSDGLGKLAAGDLSARLHEPFAPENEALRADFNRAMEQLQDMIHGIVGHVTTIKGGASELSRAADDLSQRTESQAATLEETAAALEELSASVKSTADSADKANSYVTDTQDNAGSSSAIVNETVSAMTKIKASSDQISQIIGVIDDIAFQTNLLALNAGVEAARAGDAGRGFAVVASEVRALAQRSSEAAKEIKELISTSSGHVDQGVDLVGRTGTSLGEIMDMVRNVSGLVSEITLAAREQSIGLIEVNTAIAQLDQVTQQNAAMVEESTAATHELRSEADELNQVTARFHVGGSGSGSGASRMAAAPVPAPELAPRAKVAALAGSAALAPASDSRNDDWEDF